jgi:hypothetical protein
MKAQAGLSEKMRYSEGVTGISNRWVKWSWKPPDMKRWLQMQLDENTAWTAVSKTRLARRVPVMADQPRPGVTGGHCSFELVRITAFDGRWWSLALEVSGDPSDVTKGLARAAEQTVVITPPPFGLKEADSFAYPVWLDRIASDLPHSSESPS